MTPAKPRVALLLSPAPVDGYPPVQHQARILADEGFAVELITIPRSSDSPAINFDHAQVRITSLSKRVGRGPQTIARLVDLSRALLQIRRRHQGAAIVEISYEPLGMLISDFTPMRPKVRIAHFHEVLDRMDQVWMERRLRRAIHRYQYVVVADPYRGALLSQQLHLQQPPVVVPNYPLWSPSPVYESQSRPDERFELIYAGSIGSDHKLDLILDSLCLLSDGIYFTIIGDKDQPVARDLAARAKRSNLTDRFRLEGWLDYSALAMRLSQAHLGISLLDPDNTNLRFAAGASNKRYEYMRAGLPQIGDMNPGVPALVEGNAVGACIQQFRPDEVARLVDLYRREPARRLQEGRLARKLHQERFNYQLAFAPVLRSIQKSLSLA